MKKRIQKYLSGSNEGFSLVELIIVIAIMAILVGVVALAVIPNLEKSRESKDLTTLDSLVSGVTTAIANDPSITTNGATSTLNLANVTASAASGIEKAVYDQLGDLSTTTMVSSAGKSGTLTVQYTIGGTSTSTVRAFVDDGSAAVTCKYTKDDNGNAKPLEVKNGN